MNGRLVLAIIAVLILIVIIGIVAYQMGINSRTNVAITPPVSPAPTITAQPTVSSDSASITPALSAVEVTNNFYSSYLSCAKQNIANCDYKTYPQIDTEKFVPSTNVVKGANPILCSQNVPVSISVSGLTPVMSTQATVQVLETFGAREQKQIPVTLQLENGQWKITAINCPKP